MNKVKKFLSLSKLLDANKFFSKGICCTEVCRCQQTSCDPSVEHTLNGVVSVRHLDIKAILFVCKHNKFRSKIAEAFFNKLNQNKNYIAKSAGLLPGLDTFDKKQVEVAKKFGIELRGKSKPITIDLLRKIDLMVIVADDVPPEIFHDKRYGEREEIVWKIRDDINNEENEAYKIIEELVKRVKHLVESLL